MKEFLLLFRQPSFDYSSISKEEMQALTKKWKDWAERIKAQGKFVSDGVRLSMEGKVLKPGGVITDGPLSCTGCQWQCRDTTNLWINYQEIKRLSLKAMLSSVNQLQ